MRRYVHIGTGNYHPKTSRLYTDFGLFSCNPELGADLTDLLNVLTGFASPTQYRKLIVAPKGMRDSSDDDPPNSARTERCPARILAKMNALTDPEIITALYEASRGGVRGSDCGSFVPPGTPGVSDRIRVIAHHRAVPRALGPLFPQRWQ
jgi:polyphosphate kinase